MLHQKTDLDPYVKICMKAWMLCEANVYAEIAKPLPRHQLVRECSDCASACFEMVAMLVSHANDSGILAINTILHCRQCAAECAKYVDENDIQFCGEVCSVCGDALQDVTFFSLN